MWKFRLGRLEYGSLGSRAIWLGGIWWQSPQKLKYNVKFIPLKTRLTKRFYQVLLFIIFSECNVNVGLYAVYRMCDKP